MARLVASALLITVAAACSGGHPSPIATPCPGARACSGASPLSLDVALRGSEATLTYRLAEPSRVVLIERDPTGSFVLLDSAAVAEPQEAGEHAMVVVRHLRIPVGGPDGMQCSTVTEKRGTAGGQVEDVDVLHCGYGASGYEAGRVGLGPITTAPPSWAATRNGQHLVFAILPDRPVTEAAVQQAIDQLGDEQTPKDVAAEFERLTRLPAGSTHWTVAEIPLR